MLVIPALAGLPHVYGRAGGLLEAADGPWFLRPTSLLRIEGLPSAEGLLVPQPGDQLRAVAEFVRFTTASGEPIFVYPSSPLLYVLTDRPNPTRYSHLYPGAAPPGELGGVMATLDRVPVRTIVVSDDALAFWGPPGDNAALEDYLAARYEDSTRFGSYRVLTRRTPG
jgi:hypothetical protein